MSLISVRTRAMLLVAVAIAGSSASIAASPAGSRTLFHAVLKMSWPAAHDTLAVAPDSLKLWFSEKVELPLTKVTLGAAGVTKKVGTLAFAGAGADAPVVVALQEKLAPGLYTVAWSAAGKDGHASKGTYDFVVKAGR
jgi:methionine-rich copper-binding protein CopC